MLNLALRVDPSQFKSGRHCAAWLGPVPQERSTSNKQRLSGIRRAGDERLPQLLVLGATTVRQHAKPGRPTTSLWLLELLEHRPRERVAVALTNTMARVVGAMITSGEAYCRPTPAAA